MTLLNLGCGNNRLPLPFVNLDSLRAQLSPGCVELAHLDYEENYVESNLLKALPFSDASCDGILASHIVEHFDAQDAWKLLRECYRVLLPQGVLVVSVPDTAYFKRVHEQDTKERSFELFGEQMDAGNPHKSFFDCALFFNEHKQVLTADSLWALLRKGGFKSDSINSGGLDGEVATALRAALNRPRFSLVMWAVKD